MLHKYRVFINFGEGWKQVRSFTLLGNAINFYCKYACKIDIDPTLQGVRFCHLNEITAEKLKHNFKELKKC